MDMDKIYREQSALGDELVKINAKLQVGDVQAVQLEALAKTAEEKWKEFKKNHERVETHGKATDEYIAKGYFNYIQGILISIRQQTKKEDSGNEFKIMENVEPIKEPLTFQNRSCYQKMDKLIAEIQRWLDVLLKELNEGNFSCARLSELELTDSYNRLKQLVQNSDDELCEARFVEVQKSYYQAVKKVKMQLDEQDRAPLRPNIKLEEVKIPVFNGDIKKWSAFHDLFHNLVHTSLGMAKVEKMYRLKGLLIGEPANIIQHLPATDANYEAAWSIITQRYNNTRRLFESQVDRLLDQPVVNSEMASSIKQLLDTSNECIHALEALNLNLKDAEPFIARIILRKLDREGIRRYEQATNKTREIQSLKDVLNYLDQQFHSLEATSKPSFNIKKHYHFNTKKDNMFLTAATSVVRCSFCNIQGHSNDECRKFTKLSTKQRWQSVRDKKLCYMCLNHSYVEPCQNKVGKCPKCSSRHHLLLHEDIHIKKNEEKATTSTPVTKNSNTAGEKKSVMVARQKSNPGVLLATARIRVRSANGEDLLLRALIDQGSQISAITEGAAQQLQLPRNRCKAELRGLGDVFVGAVKSKINLEVRPRFSSDAVFMAEALVLPKVANNNPAISFNYDIGEFSNYILADPCFNKADRIDVLIGADMYAAIGEGVSTKFGSILGQSTKIGLLLSGKIENVSSAKSMTVAITTELEKFWELEEIPSEHQTCSVDQCDSYFQETVSRDINTGKIVVKLPFTQEKQLGESRKIAVARQLQLERRLEANPDLKTSYIQFMDEYLAMGHMKLVEGTGEGRYYIPHQPVVKADSLTTKLRVVFDASAKSSNGSSLNDILMVGPRLQKDLFDIVVKWRLWQYVLTADVEKMYRQIMVAEEDQEYQHIVWRPRKTESLRDYKLTTVTYGTASAPFLATKALQWIGDNCEEHDKIISCIIKNDFYMDDLMTGADTKDECCYIQKKITNQLEDYGLHLRKWLSNNGDIMKQIPNFAENEVIEIADNETVKMLGLQWNPMEDIFTYRINADSNVTVTKRYALSRLARIYDPIGWLSPITIVAKLFIQQLWLLKMDWDQRLSDKLAKEWQDFIKQLENLKAVKVSRWLWTRKEEVAEIHGFADASEKAYAAVVYLKINDKITIIAAKSKVNPVKNKKTLPKLELCAAHLLAKLLSKIMSIAQRPWKVIAWSDSTIVLAWIKNNSCKQKFVKVRVAEINKLTNSADWRHVRSKDNPAGMASRGIQVVKFVDNQLWWNGPTWLKLNEDHWPKESVDNEISTVHLSSTAENNFIEKVIERCSSYNKVKRVIAYVIRFIGKLKKQPCEKYLTAKELNNAEKAIVRLHQKQEFSKEIENLQHKKDVEKSSKIANLLPFLDEEGLLRVGGRLQNCNISYTARHPCILQKSRLTYLICSDMHYVTLHGGNRIIEAMIRRNFWMIGAKNTVKKCIRLCTRCTRFRMQTAQQVMGNLPVARVTEAVPFTNTGVDYAGPVYVRVSKGRGQRAYKGYIAVFVCLATKAVHLEIVSDLSTDAFLASLRRFFGRRGKSSNIYSDNGTNFVGANHKLQEDLKKAIKSNNELAPTLEAEGVKWHFGPPAGPHFGGIWEAAVKSMKYHLKRVIGESKLTYEEFSTLLTQIEAVLNSRPICALSTNADDLDVLTPGHFLIGKPLLGCPEGNSLEFIGSLNKWKIVQKIRRDFWQRWKDEYIHSLQQRYKWNQSRNNLNVDQIVIIKDENTPPLKWPLGKIVETHPGSDGKIRVVSVKTQKGVIKRPVVKICPLQIEEGEPANLTESTRPIQVNHVHMENKAHREKKSSPFQNIYVVMLFILLFFGLKRVNALEIDKTEIIELKAGTALSG